MPSLCAPGAAWPTRGEKSGFLGSGRPLVVMGSESPLASGGPKVARLSHPSPYLTLPHHFRGQGPDAPLCKGETKALEMEQKLCTGPQNMSIGELEAARKDAQWLACGTVRGIGELGGGGRGDISLY